MFIITALASSGVFALYALQQSTPDASSLIHKLYYNN
jgi:hypothetical protein